MSTIASAPAVGYEWHVRARRDPTEFIEQFAVVKKAITAVAAQAYAHVELGSMQAKLVRHIGRRGPISQAELARVTDSDPTLTSRALATLVERDLVRRERSEEDRREYLLELTAEGKRVRTRIEKLRSELAAKVVAALDDDELAMFERMSAKIVAALTAAGD